VGEERVRTGPGASAPPLGTAHIVGTQHELAVPPGATVLAYTDGLIEQRGVALSERLAQLRDAAGTTEPEALCNNLLDALLGPDREPADDVALVAIRPDPIEAEFALTVTADPRQLMLVRRFLERWMAAAGADRRDRDAMNLAVGEACANAVEHAYGPSDSTYAVSGRREPGGIAVTVADRGRWRPPRGEDRGRGLMLMEAMMDEVEVASRDDGTTVTLRLGLGTRQPA
jgi:anti-sigma regulatory factor (Ser/Thr protein kinase)